MTGQPVRFIERAAAPLRELYGIRVGTITEVMQDGRPLVQFDGAPRTMVARIAVPLHSVGVPDTYACAPVILIFENGNPELPIIIGFIRDSIAAPRHSQERI